MHIAREDFFTSFHDRLKAHPKLTDLASAANAHVPIMSFNLDGVDFDVLFAQLPLNSVKEGMSVDEGTTTNVCVCLNKEICSILTSSIYSHTLNPPHTHTPIQTSSSAVSTPKPTSPSTGPAPPT